MKVLFSNVENRSESFTPIFPYQTVKPYEATKQSRIELTAEEIRFNRRLQRIDTAIAEHSALEANAKTEKQAEFHRLKISLLIESILPYKKDCKVWEEQEQQRKQIALQIEALQL